MNIQHTTQVANFYTNRNAWVTAEQQLDLGGLKAEATQWENADGPYESVALTARHFHAVSHTGVPNTDSNHHSVSFHNVAEVDTSDPDFIKVTMGDGSTARINIFRAAS